MPGPGRRFVKGVVTNPKGRPKGIKERIPRSFRGLAAEVIAEHPTDIKGALHAGVKGKDSHRYLAILAGLERQLVAVTGEDGGAVVIHHHFAPPTK